MFIDKENSDAWMERIMARFDRQDKTLAEMNKHTYIVDGERLLDYLVPHSRDGRVGSFLRFIQQSSNFFEFKMHIMKYMGSSDFCSDTLMYCQHS